MAERLPEEHGLQVLWRYRRATKTKRIHMSHWFWYPGQHDSRVCCCCSPTQRKNRVQSKNNRTVRRSEGFPRTRKTKMSCGAIVEGDLFLSARSCFFFLLFSSFFSHPESCLKIEIFVGRSDVLGWRRRGELKKQEKNRKKTSKNGKMTKMKK